MDIRRVKQRWIAGVVAVLVVVAAAYTGFWFLAAAKTERLVERLATGEISGYRIAHSGISTGGFPFAIRLRVDDPELAAHDQRMRWGWDAATLELRPWNLRRYRLAVFGPHNIEMGSPQDTREYAIASKHAVIVAELNSGGSLSRAKVNLMDLNITEGAARQVTAIAELELRLAVSDNASEGHSSPSLEMSLSATSVALPLLDAQPLGNELRSLRAGLKLLGSINRFDKESVDAWRREGGTLELQWLQANWGALDVRVVGTLALDDQLRPLAALTADIRGFAEALDGLESLGLISRTAATTGRVALGLIAKPSTDGTLPVLTVPLTARDGGLYLGPLRLARLPSLFR